MPIEVRNRSTEIRLWLSTSEGLVWQWVQDGKVNRQERLVYIQSLLLRSHSVSPNRRYLFIASYADTMVFDTARRQLIYLARSERVPGGSYTLAVYHSSLWAPNSQYVIGYSSGAGSECVLFQIEPSRMRVLAKERVWWSGWYPDARRVWFAQFPPETTSHKTDPSTAPHYSMPISGGRPTRLGRSEVRRLLTDWDYLALGWKKGLGDPCDSYDYTLDRQLRVGWRLDGKPTTLHVESRDSKKSVLTAPFSSLSALRPLDISADKQHLLVLSPNWDFYEVNIARNQWAKIGNLEDFTDGTLLYAEFVESANLVR